MSDFGYSIKDISEFLGGSVDDETVISLVETFINMIDTEFQKLSEAVEHGDKPAIHKIGHKMKGAAANMCFEKFRALTETIEKNANQGNDIDYKDYLNRLSLEKDNIKEWYKTITS